ncbi:hypothetical protein GJU35_44575 [Streptomyces lincolnensis]|nr:hypothetical protein GJU35_00345 [Streptomyces lincolnensis]QMV12027.1 hypothetical protein GJU35_44575 [Streptomyces lincolnensis]
MTNRRHPIGSGPEGEGVRYLSAEQQPEPACRTCLRPQGAAGAPAVVQVAGDEHRGTERSCESRHTF